MVSIRSAASLTNKPRELPPEAIAFAEQASHDQAERGAVAAPAPAPVAAPAAPAAVESTFGEMTKAKFFHLPNRIIWALKDEALARSSGQRPARDRDSAGHRRPRCFLKK